MDVINSYHATNQQHTQISNKLTTSNNTTSNTSPSQQVNPNTSNDRVTLSSQVTVHSIQTASPTPSNTGTSLERVLYGFGEQLQQQLTAKNTLSAEEQTALNERFNQSEVHQINIIVEGLKSPPTLNKYGAVHIQTQATSMQFIDALERMDTDTRQQVLEQARQHAGKITGDTEVDLYYADGSKSDFSASTQSNDLHNFINAVTNAPDVEQLLGKLSPYNSTQKSDLLQIMGNNLELGMRMMDSLAAYNEQTQSAILEYNANLTRNADTWMAGIAPINRNNVSIETGDSNDQSLSLNVGSPLDFTLDGYENISHLSLEEQLKLGFNTDPDAPPRGSVAVDYDNGTTNSAWRMIENTISIMEQYKLSDEQLLKMNTDLRQLDMSDQRAYLTITRTALEHLLSPKNDNEIQPEQRAKVMNTVEALRQQ